MFLFPCASTACVYVVSWGKLWLLTDLVTSQVLVLICGPPVGEGGMRNLPSAPRVAMEAMAAGVKYILIG